MTTEQPTPRRRTRGAVLTGALFLAGSATAVASAIIRTSGLFNPDLTININRTLHVVGVIAWVAAVVVGVPWWIIDGVRNRRQSTAEQRHS